MQAGPFAFPILVGPAKMDVRASLNTGPEARLG